MRRTRVPMRSVAIDSRIPEKPIRKSQNVWKPQKIAHKGATEAQHHLGCIGHTHARAKRSNQRENDCKDMAQRRGRWLRKPCGCVDSMHGRAQQCKNKNKKGSNCKQNRQKVPTEAKEAKLTCWARNSDGQAFQTMETC